MTRAEREEKQYYLIRRFKLSRPAPTRKAVVRFENVVFNAGDEEIEKLYAHEKRNEECEK